MNDFSEARACTKGWQTALFKEQIKTKVVKNNKTPPPPQTLEESMEKSLQGYLEDTARFLIKTESDTLNKHALMLTTKADTMISGLGGEIAKEVQLGMNKLEEDGVCTDAGFFSLIFSPLFFPVQKTPPTATHAKMAREGYSRTPGPDQLRTRSVQKGRVCPQQLSAPLFFSLFFSSSGARLSTQQSSCSGGSAC